MAIRIIEDVFELDSAEVSRLKEIQQEILSLLEEAESLILTHASKKTINRAQSCWISNIKRALTKDHGLPESMFDMDDTIEEMLGD